MDVDGVDVVNDHLAREQVRDRLQTFAPCGPNQPAGCMHTSGAVHFVPRGGQQAVGDGVNFVCDVGGDRRVFDPRLLSQGQQAGDKVVGPEEHLNAAPAPPLLDGRIIRGVG